jgi:mRNA interferase RelE/StbE
MVHSSCVGYEIVFSDDAKKDLKKLDRQIIVKILKKTKSLISPDPNSLNIKKLKSKFALYRLRAGDYRIVYCIKHETITVYFVAIGHRRDIYNVLDRRLGSII